MAQLSFWYVRTFKTVFEWASFSVTFQIRRPTRLSSDIYCSATPTRRFTTSNSWRVGYGTRDEKAGQAAGPAKEKLRLIPFRMNVTQAEEVNQITKIEALYLPFWAASGSVRSKIINAQVGWDRVVMHYNRATGRNEPSWETVWRPVQTLHEFSNTYPSTLPELQIYASYKYRRGFVNQIRSSTSILSAKALEPRDMESTDPEDQKRGVQNRGLDPFTMKPSIAVKFVKSAIEDNEVRMAEKWLVDANMVLAPVYVPAYVFSMKYLDRTFRTFLQANDPTGLVGGIRFYSWQRVSAVTALCAMTGFLLLGTSRFGMTMTSGFWLGVVAPTLVTAWSVLYYPILDLRIRDWWRQREMEGHESESSSSTWDADWTKAYDRFEEEQRRQDWNENRQYQYQSSSYGSRSESSKQKGPAGDPLGYYATLGVSKDATIQEIQSAFRGLAMKWHPDRFSTPGEKAKGKKKFQEITAAYSVLRDVKKRKAYDILACKLICHNNYSVELDYYFQEDSSDDSTNSVEESPTPSQPAHAFQHTSPPQNRRLSDPTLPPLPSRTSTISSSTSSSSTPSFSPRPSPKRAVSSKETLPSPKTQNTQSLLKTKGSPEQQKSTATLKAPVKSPIKTTEDARSIAVAIEDQEMLSRSDLEESLLKNIFSPVKSLESENVSVLYGSSDKHLPWTDTTQQHPLETMRFVPQTRVFYINKKYRSVFMVDVSSSVLTVDSGGTKIVMGQVMETLTKCLTGLSERFSCPGMKQDFVQSEIHITVIAECSQFASNLHTGEILANFPTMKVLLQDVALTKSNLMNVLQILRIQLAKFQMKLSRFRGELRRSRETLGYSLAVEEAVDDVNTELDLEDDISQRKSWGVGLSGANLSYTLTAGLFALSLMPKSASPSLIVLTDGVVKSNLLHGSTILRRLMELDVSCSIIQLGSRGDAIPSCNWGFIQDTEALRFVTDATLGKFMYSQDCISIDTLKSSQNSPSKRMAPNMYHRAFLIRELCLLKPRPGLDDFEDKDDSPGYSLANFPWDPKSIPEPIKMMQTACKDYHLNIPVELLVAARIRQGFRIKGVSVGPDRDRGSFERYMITMTLAWLPNVTVQYRLKGQVSSDNNSSYFSRFESPMVEIDIIAYQAFAIHFLNSQHAPVNASHSVYAKVFRIHRYIVGLSDSDVALRGLNNSHASANQALWTQRAKTKERTKSGGAISLTGAERDKEELAMYLSRLSEQWSGLAKDADYQYSRGWYNEYEFEAMLVVPPPAFLPTAMDTKNSLVKYSEGLVATVNGIHEYLKGNWASFVHGDVFIQTYQAPESSPTTTSNAQFCELRLSTEPNVAILRVQLRFFGVSFSQRQTIIKGLKNGIYAFQARQNPGTSSKTESEVIQAQVLQCQRPIHRLLMRHLVYEAPLSHKPESNLNEFHTHVSEPIGKESVMRSYLVHKHWGWKDQVRDSAYLAENNYMASQDLAFQYICAQRMSEGFYLASALPNRVVFYKEVELPTMEGSLICGTRMVQYLIFRSPVSGELVTELWMEPTIDANRFSLFDKFKSEIIAVDRFVLSRLATYEAIHTIGRLRLRPEVQQQNERDFVYPWLFDPATLLRQQRLVTLSFEAPRRCYSIGAEHGKDDISQRKCIHTLGLGISTGSDAILPNQLTTGTGHRELFLTRHSNASTTSLNLSIMDVEPTPATENELVTEYKDQLRELCCTDRDLAILHLFMEQALSQLADGEIMPGGEDDACNEFFLDIKTSIKRNAEVRQALMTFHCANSFQDIRCFVKSVNAKFFRLIIVPRLGSVISHLTKLRSLPPRENEDRSERVRRDFLSCLMFECLRSKPLVDISEYNASALDQSHALFELHPVSLGPSVSQQPLLIQPVVNEDQGKARVQESTMQLIRSISQAYSHSFTKAIYTSLLEGHPIDHGDLKKASQICTKNTVDINITGFINTLEQSRRLGVIRDDSAKLKARFLDVLKHSFELAPGTGSDRLYFYRPALRRAGPKLVKPRTRKRSPSVSRSGSIDADMEDALSEVIDCAEQPMFLHLECSFQKPLTQPADLERAHLKSSVTFPVSDIPVSYLYQEKDSRVSDYAPTSIGFDSRPVDSADGTVAILHLVISTLPMAEDYAGPTLKTIDSETKMSIDSNPIAGSRNFQHIFPSLDSTQVDAIADAEARLEWLVKEEIMHGLLDMTPVTVDILNLVETQLKTKSSFVAFPTAMTLPLTFVKKRRGHEIFMQELARADMLPYELHQAGPYFYLTEGADEIASTDGTEDQLADQSVVSGEDLDKDEVQDGEIEDLPSLSSSLKKDSTLPPSDDLCHGLGIVILPTPKPSHDSSSGLKNLKNGGVSRKKRKFWLILVPKETYVQVYFFSKFLSEEACNTIMSRVRKAVDELCVKVNRLTLLQSLNETRNCSKYLVPSDSSDSNADSESGSDSDMVSQDDDDDNDALVTGGSRPIDDGISPRKFQPGEFACPMVYRVAWPLHWRVKPGQATKSVAHLVLYPFAVQNRKNFFVVESQDDHDESKKVVVFLRLNEVEVQTLSEQNSGIGIDDTKAAHLAVGKGDDSSTPASSSIQNIEDNGSHANSPRPSPTASPGSRTPAPPAIRTDTRELVIEVYGVEAPGKQVTVDLFSLLENKFYNSVVLSVVSTFLSRNATLKLTQADVDFILPVERLEPTRQLVEIPQFINAPYAFLMYLKQNLSLYLNPLTGTDKVNALTRYYNARYGRLSTSERYYDRCRSHQMQIGDFAFFYNCVQGRSPTPIESQVGIGLAGVCLTVLGRDLKPVFEVGYQEVDHDKEDIRKYFDSFPNSSGLKPSSYSLMIEVWAQGSVNAGALVDAICQSFRQSLCDDIIETSIAQGLCPSARDRRNDVDDIDGEPLIGERVQKNFIDPSFLVLENAYQWKNPAVQSLSLKYTMPPWIMDSFLLELDEILTDVSVHFSPLLIRSMAESNRYKEYRASSGTRKSFGDMTNVRFVLIGGIQDLNDGSNSSYYGRRTSMGSDRTHSRRSSLAEGQSLHHSHKTSTHSSQQLPKRQLEDIKMYPNAVTTSGQDETMLTRNCFVMITANGFGLQAYTYNWGKTYHEFMFSGIEKIVKWHKDRMCLLDNVLLQKMGLFHHVPSILSISAASSAPSAPVQPSLTNSSNLIQVIPRTAPHGSPHLGSNLRTSHSESNSSTPNLTKSSTSPKSLSTATVLSDAANLASLVEDQFPNRLRNLPVGSSLYGNEDGRLDLSKASSSTLSLVARPSPSAALSSQSHAQAQSQSQSDQNSSSGSTVITTGLDVDQILRDYCLEPLETPRDEDQIQDEVQRHGKPFLDTFTFHTKNAEDQQNAYNVYQKWSRRYRDRKGSPNALHENMNTTDLAIMLRSSRLLHFCRTPLLFTEFSSSLFPRSDPTVATGIAANGKAEPRAGDGTKDTLPDPIVQWYSDLAETFMREYSQYLATVGMQLLMYGNSKFDKPVEPSQAGELSFMSQFTVSQTLSVPSPAAFLFKSLQGGSIMCEVRLQGMFVCVTLYTLNRRYGRVKVAAPGFATAEANKQSLRVFTEQCARFKDRIHVNSFVYDFHLRYIHRILMESSKIPVVHPSNDSMKATSTKLTTLPFSFDLMDVLHQFLQYHSRPAAYARNRVYRGIYRTNVAPGESELPGHLFDYMIKNPQRYGFQTIHYQGRPRACFISGRDLLSGFGGTLDQGSGGFSAKAEHLKRASESVKQSLKGFGVGASRGGLSTGVSANSQKPFGPHTRHTSHESSLNTKRTSRRMTTSRSSYNMKECTILQDEGVEYALVISEGDQDSMGLTVHYYLLILREEEVVKKLEDAHGPLVGARDRLLAASRSMLVMRDNDNTNTIHRSPELTTNTMTNQLQPAQPVGDEDKPALEPRQSLIRSLRRGSDQADMIFSRDHFSGGERLMDATELQERITERAVLGDVVRAAEVRLDMMLKQAAQFFDRDSLWEMLVQGKIGNSGMVLAGPQTPLISASHAINSPSTVLSADASDYLSHRPISRHENTSRNNDKPELGFADFLALGQRFHSTPLEEMEPEFRAIATAPGIDWNQVLTFLGRYYERWAREFMEYDESKTLGPTVTSLKPGWTQGMHRHKQYQEPIKCGKARRHLVIFNPHNRDLLVHFVVNINNTGAATTQSGTASASVTTDTISGSDSKISDGDGSNRLMRTSTGDLYSRFNRRNSGASTRYKVHSQSHSHLQALLASPSLSPSSQRSQQQPQLQQQDAPQSAIRPSFSETSSRVSSMTSIARAASLAVSKVASRLQSSRSREPSVGATFNPVSGKSSRPGSSVVEDDSMSASGWSSIQATPSPVAGMTGSSTILSPLPRPEEQTRSQQTSGGDGLRRIAPNKTDSGESRRRRGGEPTESDTEDYVYHSDELTDSDNVSEPNLDQNGAGSGEDDDERERNSDDSGELDEHEDDDNDDDEAMDEYVRVYSVSREPKSGYNAIESEHVGDIIRTLSYWIWRAQKQST
ncbi:KICSTOR complex protein szt2 [Linnemannia zychae]|nr:KICSTOR complex protein szt2 [Linnemannia zychae]